MDATGPTHPARGLPAAVVDAEPLYADELAPGTLVGAYTVEALHGAGGFAHVYRARRADGGDRVALKVLRAPASRAVRIASRFAREVEALQRVDHPNIVRVFDAGELHDGRPYLAMQWLPGPTLREAIAARGRLAPRDVLAVVRDIAGALDAAHAAGIVHRDLKAQNVITVPRGDGFGIKVVDFGIAKLRLPEDGDASFTSRTVLGTPETAAPEQILGERVDARADVYALGVLAFHMLTGRPPFWADTAVELEELHLSAAPPRASESAAVPAAVDAVLARAMAKRPDERPRSAGAFADALAGALAEPPAARAACMREPGAAVWVCADDGDASDDALARIDGALAAAEEAAARAGLRVAVATPSAVLAIGLGGGARDRAERVAATVRAVAAGAPVRVAVCDGDLVVRRFAGGEWDPIDGSLLRPGTWE